MRGLAAVSLCVSLTHCIFEWQECTPLPPYGQTLTAVTSAFMARAAHMENRQHSTVSMEVCLEIRKTLQISGLYAYLPYIHSYGRSL